MSKFENEKAMDMERNYANKRCTTVLCHDLVSIILVRLPVKSLIKFSCVSKSWNSLIQSPNFIAAQKQYHKDRRYLLYIPQCPASFTIIQGRDVVLCRRNLRLPFDSYKVVGSCNGLVLCVVDFHSQVYLWNPLLQTIKFIPPSPSAETTPQNKDSFIQYGLGYSCMHTDHKIIKIIYNRMFRFSPNKVEIYSLKSDSWKCTDCYAPAVARGSTGFFINGCIKWMTGTGSFSTIMSFDIDQESFWNTKSPIQGRLQQSLQERDWPRLADVNKDILRWVTIPKECENYKCNSLWMMKAFACENSWIRLVFKESKVKAFLAFDGEILIKTACPNIINFLGFDVHKRRENKNLLDLGFHIFCVSESLELFNCQKVGRWINMPVVISN